MNWAEFHFLRPDWLGAIVILVIVIVLVQRNKLNRRSWTTVCDEALLPYILQEQPSRRRRWPVLSGYLAALLSIIALAGPVWDRLPAPVFRNDAALVIILDLSHSMDATDIKPSRLIRARYKVSDILKQRKDGQTALVAYAGDAFVVSPLTEDIQTIASQLTALTTQIMPIQGSQTLAAIEQATGLLKQSGMQRGDILLLTDAVESRLQAQIKETIGPFSLSVLGVGTSQGAPVPTSGGGLLKDSAGNIVIPGMNVSDLNALAGIGGGRYRTISADDSDVAALIAGRGVATDEERGAENDLRLNKWEERGPWLLFLVLPLVALNFRKGMLTLALLAFLPWPQQSYALDWPSFWQTRTQQAQAAFARENYEQAAAQFDAPDWKAAAQYRAGDYEQAAQTLQNTTAVDSEYNRGNALARAGQLQEAVEAYQRALEVNPEHEDAQFNKTLVEERLAQNSENSENSENSQQGEPSSESAPKDSLDQQQSGDDEAVQGDRTQHNENQPAKEQVADTQAQQQSPDPTEAVDESENMAQEGDQDKDSDVLDQVNEQAENIEENARKIAGEQWLKRIPDNPAGLLERKFRYQYQQRARSAQPSQAW